MRVPARSLGLLTLVAAFVVFAFGASSAQGAFGIANWESLTCKENKDTPLPPGEKIISPTFPIPQSGEQCLESTSSKWFTQSSGHPNAGITDFTLNNAGGVPEGFVKDIVVETPEGLSVNPEALAQCPLAQAEADVTKCPPTTLVGINYLTLLVPGPFFVRASAPVYNVVPFDGHPSMVAFPDSAKKTVYIVGSLDPVDQHVTFTISDTPEPPAGPALIGSRLVIDEGESILGPGNRFGNGTYLTLPSNCGTRAKATLRVTSHAGETAEEPFETPYNGTGCENVPFEPTLKTTVNSSTDSPDPATINLGIPFDPTKPIANSYLKVARVTLPEGAGINPSLANGLETCSNAQFAYHTNNLIQCPKGSEIGTVDVETPSLPPGSLHGKVRASSSGSSSPSSQKDTAST
jgi:hypothetical protein